MTDLTIPNEILRQLGGPRFQAMTGARDFMGTDRALTCRLMRNAKGITHLRITLTDADVYYVECLKVNKRGDSVLAGSCNDVYNDELIWVVERLTGLALRL